MKKQIRKAHQQHTKKFKYELNSVRETGFQPVRYHDKVITMGKHSGKKLSNVPNAYIKWMLINWNGLTDRTVKLLTDHLKNHGRLA